MTEAEKALGEANEAFSTARMLWQASQSWNIAGLTPDERVKQDFEAEKLYVRMQAAYARLEDARKDAIFAAPNPAAIVAKGE